MKNKGQIGVGAYVIMAVAIIFCIALLTASAEQTSLLTQKQPVTDKTTDLSATGCLTAGGQVNESNSACNITADNWYSAGDWRLSDSQCYLSAVTVSNDTTSLTVDTDYVLFESTGIIQMLNTTETENGTIGNDVLIDYSYCDSGYNKDSGSRTIANLILLFAALALLAFILEYSGITNWSGMFR